MVFKKKKIIKYKNEFRLKQQKKRPRKSCFPIFGIRKMSSRHVTQRKTKNKTFYLPRVVYNTDVYDTNAKMR